MGLDAKSEIVLALAAPIHICQTPSRRTLAVAAFKFENRSHDVVADELIRRLKLSGCAVISKGILVVEGETSAINRFSKYLRLIVHKKPDFGVKFIWRGKLHIHAASYKVYKFLMQLGILLVFGTKGPIADKIPEHKFVNGQAITTYGRATFTITKFGKIRFSEDVLFRQWH